MKIAIVGNNRAEALKILKEFDLEIVEKNPEFVVSFGGDGTFMKSEFQYPGIPKIILKDSRICKVCSPLPNEEILQRVKAGTYTIKELEKLEIKVGNKILTGINDIVVHNADPRHGIRYSLWIDDKQVGDTIIGDGVVVATPLGSTGYYRSITDSFFELGIGVAFNNSTEQADHMVIDGRRIIKINIVRGPAVAYVDNQDEHIQLEEGQEIVIKKSDKVARILVV